MNLTQLRQMWKEEERAAYVHGWDFSHITENRRCVEGKLPWDYRQVIERYRTDRMNILDYDTGGGEFLLSLNHPCDKTFATEGYGPNVELCRQKLLPMGIHFKECDDPEKIPFEDERFDLILNRHGDFNGKELCRLLKQGGLFITQQVGRDNDRDLVELVLPGTERPFPDCDLNRQKKALEDVGFQIVEEAEAYRPIRFYDVGAFVWFARIIHWEFPGFCVDRCMEPLLEMQRRIEADGYVEGTIHRYLMVAVK